MGLSVSLFIFLLAIKMTQQYIRKNDLFVVESINGFSGPVTLKSSETVKVTNHGGGHISFEGAPTIDGGVENGESRMADLELKTSALDWQPPSVDGGGVMHSATTSIVGELDVSAGARISGSVVTPLIQTWTASVSSHSSSGLSIITGASPYPDGTTGTVMIHSGVGVNTGDVYLKSGDTIIEMNGDTPAATSSGDINILTGDSENGDSGDINIRTGGSDSGRGSITLEGVKISIGSEDNTPGLMIYGLDDLHTLLYVDGTGIHFAHPTLAKDIVLPWGFAGAPPAPDGPGSAG
jgi:hypothetical protein